MLLDAVSIALRATGFIAMLQAAGLALFAAIFAAQLSRGSARLITMINRMIQLSAATAVLLVLTQQLLEAGRMAGELSGVLDASLQRLAWLSTAGAATLVRLAGLLVMVWTSRTTKPAVADNAWLGALLVCAGFLLAGHTAAHALRGLLAPLLMVHLLIASLWFGSLLPLYVVSKHESPVTAAQLTEAFSMRAVWLVPLIALAGIIMTVVLLPHWTDLLQPYGLLLMAKFTGFALLIGLATLNKWRLGPRLREGDARTHLWFRRIVLSEFGLITAVLMITAVMTGWYSPE